MDGLANWSTNCCHTEASLEAPKSKAPRPTPPLPASELDVPLPAPVQSRPPLSAVLPPANPEPASAIQLPASNALVSVPLVLSAINATMWLSPGESAPLSHSTDWLEKRGLSPEEDHSVPASSLAKKAKLLGSVPEESRNDPTLSCHATSMPAEPLNVSA